MAFTDFYRGRKALITGHAGFKGSWLALMLKKLGAEVYGYSLVPDTEFTAYEVLGIPALMDGEEIGDIRDRAKLEGFFGRVRPEMVFHLAAQPLVRLSYSVPFDTYDTNVMGSLNVMEAARKCGSVAAFVNVTTDKCYENMEISYAYKESDPMGGYDMYSSSKACSEILTASYRRSFLSGGRGFGLASARAGNVIGGGDWSLDRLVPDCAKALSAGKSVSIRNPHSVRPWQHVMESLTGYMLLGQKLAGNPEKYAQGYNFGPEASSVLEVGDIVRLFIDVWGGGSVETQKSDGPHEANLLMLDISKAKKELGFEPVMSARQAVRMTAQWYRNFYSGGAKMRAFTESQIDEFTGAAAAKKLDWSI